MKKVKLLAGIAALLLAGCDDLSFTYKDETPQPVMLSFTTPAGGLYQVSVPESVDPAAIIAANTQLGNALIQDVTAQKYQAQADARRDWLGVVHTALVCFACCCFGLGAIKMILAELRRGKS